MAKRKWLNLDQQLREIWAALDALRTHIGTLSEVRAILVHIRDEPRTLQYVEELRARFAEEVRAVQATRQPDSMDLTMAKQVADVARGVLLKLEWSHIDANSKMRNPRCPICLAAKSTGHKRDCALFQVVGPPRAADSE